MKSGEGNGVESGEWTAETGAERGVWRAEWRLENGVRSGNWRVECGPESGEWRMASEFRFGVECGVESASVECGEWSVESRM